MVSEVRRLRKERQMEKTPGQLDAEKRAQDVADQAAADAEAEAAVSTDGSPSE